jgi:hypothetical protein
MILAPPPFARAPASILLPGRALLPEQGFLPVGSSEANS